MLTFFVLLYSMSAPSVETWEEMTTGIKNEFQKFRGAQNNRGPQDTIDVSRINFNRALDINYLNALIGRHIEGEEVLKEVELRSMSGGLVVSFPQDMVFESGKAEMSEQGSDAVYALALTLSKIRNRIEILGHTDPGTISGEDGKYKSNWEFSLARASTIAAALRKVGYDRPLMVRGLGDAIYNSLPEELSEAEKLKTARKVDILIMGDDGSLETFNGLTFE
jgi:chemotaxis protein MotB